MPTIKRKDGVQFAIRPYRDWLAVKKSSLLRQEIRNLAQNHGEYIRLFKQPSGQLEGVFSRDPGYLLGESIWHYFNKPSNLIYCEALPDQMNALVVIIRANTVHLDNKIPLADLGEELASLLVTGNRYEIYFFGKLPISRQPEPDKFVFDEQQVRSFTELSASVVDQLPLWEELQLQPLELALKTVPQAWSFATVSAIGLVFVALIAAIWWILQPAEMSHKTVVMPAPSTVPQMTPAQWYQQALLAKPAPASLMNVFLSAVYLSESIPGWQPQKITWNDDICQVQVQSNGAPASLLFRWAQSRHLNFSFNSDGATLTLPCKATARQSVPPLQSINQPLSILLDRFSILLMDNSQSQVGAFQNQNGLVIMPVSINFADLAPDMVMLLGHELADLPVSLNSLEMNVKDGLLSGKMLLTVVGT